MPRISGTLDADKRHPSAWTGHWILSRYSATFDSSGAVSSDAAATIPRQAVESRTPVEPDGRFVVDLPESFDRKSPVDVSVVAPSGQVLIEQAVSVEAEAQLDLNVTPAQPATLAAAGIQADSKRVRGLLTDLVGNPARNIPLVLMSDADSLTLLATTTDATGQFFGDVPARRFSSVTARIGTQPPATASIILNDGLLPDQINLSADLPAPSTTSASDCGCASDSAAPPRLPNQADLTVPGAYSTDLGTGCVNLSTPDRSVEEFDFFSVVRTTQPEIRGFSPETPRTVSKPLAAEIAKAANVAPTFVERTADGIPSVVNRLAAAANEVSGQEEADG